MKFSDVLQTSQIPPLTGKFFRVVTEEGHNL